MPVAVSVAVNAAQRLQQKGITAGQMGRRRARKDSNPQPTGLILGVRHCAPSFRKLLGYNRFRSSAFAGVRPCSTRSCYTLCYIVERKNRTTSSDLAGSRVMGLTRELDSTAAAPRMPRRQTLDGHRVCCGGLSVWGSERH